MSIFLDAQPEAYRDAVAALLRREAVPSALMIGLDFADEPVRMCNRNVPFSDLRWGHIWGAGAHVPVAINDIEEDSEELAPFREYAIGIPPPRDTPGNWRASIVDSIRDVANYRRPVYGMQTDMDQQRRYPGDLGMQFTAEASKLVVWTDF